MKRKIAKINRNEAKIARINGGKSTLKRFPDRSPNQYGLSKRGIGEISSRLRRKIFRFADGKRNFTCGDRSTRQYVASSPITLVSIAIPIEIPIEFPIEFPIPIPIPIEFSIEFPIPIPIEFP